MKSIIHKTIISTLILTLFGTVNLSAQFCSGGTYWSTLTPTAAYQVQSATYAGYYYSFAASAGASYEFTYCAGGGVGAWDGQLTILDNI